MCDLGSSLGSVQESGEFQWRALNGGLHTPQLQYTLRHLYLEVSFFLRIGLEPHVYKRRKIPHLLNTTSVGSAMDRKILDYTLVPSGFLLMVAYHVWLFYRIIRQPNDTVVGVNAFNRRFWVRAMMEDQAKNGVLAVQTLRNNIMASTLLASTAIMLSSLIAVLMSNGSMRQSSYLMYGDASELGFSIKFFSILVCFLVSFLLNVQSIRYYSHASILINVPVKNAAQDQYVAATVNRGSYFWSLGLRAFYFSFPLFFWLFGPIPMFLCCFVMVFLLYFLDATFEFGLVSDEEHGSCE